MLLGAESFEAHAAGGTLAGTFNLSGAGTIVTGRDGAGNAWQSGGPSLDIPLGGAGFDELWVAIAIRAVSVTLAGTIALVQFRNGSGAIFSLCWTDSDRRLELRSGGTTGTILAHSTITFPVDTLFREVGLKVKFDGSVGTVQLRVLGQGALDVDLSNQDTAGVAGDCTIIRIAGGGTIFGFDDLVWGNVAGSHNTACPPDLRVKWVPPTADTVQADFTPSAGADNFAMVDDVPNDGDTSHNESSNPGDEDRFTHSETLTGVAIRAICPTVIAKGGSTMRLVLTGSAATEEDNGADLDTDAGTYGTRQGVWEEDPDTAAPFSVAGFEDADFSFGYRVTS